jgi:hypothetical protein
MRCTRLLAVLHSVTIFEFPLLPAQTDCWAISKKSRGIHFLSKYVWNKVASIN